ncbi:hypothetical protein SAMN05421664_0865 [Chryseobacterium soldanellicola]|uniref:Uncharacterized protein n=1 Tax=Chryseobacterium soldanellicola TaxID=311333 RepID=A0A1H0YQK6_9FLAO|nr:hypothetical protein [Chryseobacterium soldanellicola]SDQ17126.1 hypothetical protein SAMN05421664_0865 [Chryseobacterium soldanellicola]
MKKIFFLVVCVTVINISCQKKGIIDNFTKSPIDTLSERPTILYFDDDDIKDKVEIISKPDNKILNFKLSVHLSTLNKSIEIPILNNSILYNNKYSAYYISDPVIKNKIIEFRIDYADHITVPNNSGEKKNLIEKIKIRFNLKSKKIQIIGYDLTYSKENKNKYTKSFNFITGKYYSSCYFDNDKKETSGWASELQNIYIQNWNHDFLNKISLYGNEIE